MLQPPEPHSPLLGSDVLLSFRDVGLHWVQPLPGCFWSGSEHTPHCPLVLLSAVKFSGREDDLYFDVQSKVPGGMFPP